VACFTKHVSCVEPSASRRRLSSRSASAGALRPF
jgi:hypothetical protein